MPVEHVVVGLGLRETPGDGVMRRLEVLSGAVREGVSGAVWEGVRGA